MRRNKKNRSQLLFAILALLLFLPLPAAKADNPPSSILKPLNEVSPTPSSNCKESKGNNRPCDEKAFEADTHQSDPQGGPEKLGTQQETPPDRAGNQMGQAVQSGGPQQCKEKNTAKQNTKPMCGAVQGGSTKCMFVSAFGTTIDYKPYLKQDPRVVSHNDVEHNQGGLGNILIPAGLEYGSAGQLQHGASLMNSQTVPVASQLAGIETVLADNLAQKVPNPRGWAKVAKGVQQAQNAQNADNQGNCAQQNCENAFTNMKLPLINVANENAASPCSAQQPFKDESNVIWMVQQMYKKCYMQMAVLFLLPGALLTQAKSLVSYGLLGNSDEDTSSPFVGIFRAIMAIFLIPATQLTVSYCIDIGNALTEPVAKRVQVETLMNWVKEQAYATDPKNNDGCIKNVDANMGKLQGTPSASAVQERQNDLNVSVQNMFNTINALLSQGLEVLGGFQLVMMCYLFLLGPIAAALYAWPAAIGRDLFKKSFASWLDGVIVLSLWKFWWCIVLLCMVVRLQSGDVDPNSHYEMYYYTAFMGILVMVPFQPFEFRPGEVVSHVLEKAQQGGGGGGASGAGAGAGKGGGQGGNPPSGSQSGGSSSGTASTKTAGSANPSTDSSMPVAMQGDGASTSSAANNAKGTDTESTGPGGNEQPDAGDFNKPIKMAGDIDLPPMA